MKKLNLSFSYKTPYKENNGEEVSFLFVFVNFSKQFLNSKLVLKDCCNGRPMGCPGSCGDLCNHLLDHGHLQIHLGIVDYTGNRNTEILKSHLNKLTKLGRCDR